MNQYLYVLAKYFIVVTVLVLFFIYTDTFTFSILSPIMFLIFLSIIFDIIFFKIMCTASCNDNNVEIDEIKKQEKIEGFGEYVAPRVNKDIRLHSVYQNNGGNVETCTKEKTIAEEKPRLVDKDKSEINNARPLGKVDDGLFNNYEPDYYEEDIEHVHNMADKSKYISKQMEAYNIYLKNSYRASLG